MEQIPVVVEYSDKEYSRELSRALGLRCKAVTIYDSDSAPPEAYILNEKVAALYTPVSQIIAKIMAENNRHERPAKALQEIIFTAFSSVTGGSGKTSSALLYAGIISRLKKIRTAFISFDPVYTRINSNKDEYGVFILSGTYTSLDSLSEKLSDYDELVIDIPFNYENYFDVLDMCDIRYIVMGFDEKRREYNEKFFSDLVSLSDSYINPPITKKFYNSFDPYFEQGDIHGQLGNEILRLINEN